MLSPDYILGRHFVASDDPSAAGMQGQPHNIEDMTDGQAEERFYQLVFIKSRAVTNDLCEVYTI